MICPLCQHCFDEQSACHGCGVIKGCTLLKCPHCGYEFAQESKTVSLFKRIAARFKKPKENERDRKN